jgi:hypothetical protein
MTGTVTEAKAVAVPTLVASADTVTDAGAITALQRQYEAGTATG